MKKLSLVLCACAILQVLTGCTGRNPSSSFDREKIEASLVDGNTMFALDIFKQINKEDKEKSIFISPFSISTALTMAYEGAGSTTKESMGKALGYSGIDTDKLNESYKNLIRYQKQADNKVQINISNSLWVRDGFNVKEEYLAVNKDVFDAKISSLDFSKQDAADRINQWISDSTKGKIEKMIEPPISSEAMMYLINAIYFKADWTERFDKKTTFSTKFHKEKGDAAEIMMMNRKGKIEYGEGNEFKAVRIPYGSGKTSMYCILPSQGTSVNNFIEKMNLNKWKSIKESVKETENVIIQIPRFKLEYGLKELKDSLTALGMGEAFSGKADFSGIGDVFISKVLHKAVIEVNEDGSEASSATVVEMRKGIKEPTSFIANRPFVFVIADDETNTILFMGKYYGT